MRLNNVELKVVVKNKAITEYPHNGQTFIEGREGSNFEIVVTNHNGYRVEAVVAVDGLSILDGKEAGPQSDGYLLNPNETISIPGWKLNESQVAAFQFSGKGGSYSALTTGSPRNTGVIGLLVYREKYVPRHHYAIPNTYAPNPIWTGGPLTSGMPGHLGLGGLTSSSMGSLHADQMNTLVGGSNINAAYGVVSNCMATSLGMAESSIQTCSAAAPQMRSYAKSAVGPKGMSGPQGPQGPRGDMGAPGISVNEIDQSYQPASVQNLGTAFGAAQTYATQTVEFNRGDMQAMLVLYYDNARGLKARGIVLTRTRKDAVMASPNAFPGLSGCTPPAGWNG